MHGCLLVSLSYVIIIRVSSGFKAAFIEASPGTNGAGGRLRVCIVGILNSRSRKEPVLI